MNFVAFASIARLICDRPFGPAQAAPRQDTGQPERSSAFDHRSCTKEYDGA
ncbi:hypothetical protein [Novosphingobium sp. HII-3]|jgi:hypothetical protein|uniref:hypothetical protein n=1 Tax=Novosphingobium sp. HII-3 TaxID=2075565 RepID=UPI001304E037|nr:hypothetical protein [Novosphingobium sp. HII-3]